MVRERAPATGGWRRPRPAGRPAPASGRWPRWRRRCPCPWRCRGRPGPARRRRSRRRRPWPRRAPRPAGAARRRPCRPGSTSATTSSMPTWPRRHRPAVARCRRSAAPAAGPGARSCVDRRGAGGLHGVGHDEHGPRVRRPSRRDHGRAPGRLGLVAGPRRARRAAASAQSASRRGPAGDDGVAVDHALHAEALAVGEALDRRAGARPLARRARRWPGRSGARWRASERADQPQQPRRRRRRRPPTTSTRLIRPVVTVPVLSSTTVSTWRVRLQHLGSLDEDAQLRAPAGARPAARSAWPARARTGRR